MTANIRYVNRLDKVSGLPAHERRRLGAVCERYEFRANDYYLGLIDWNDPADPIRRIVIPDPMELTEWGDLDASGESHFTVMPGLEHKYADTAVLLVNNVCGGICRFCFRKRLFLEDNEEITRDITEPLKYIRAQRGITNVLLTGGDPLLLSTRRLGDLIGQLRTIDHVGVIRIGTKMPAFNPHRILDDPDLEAMIRAHSGPRRRLYFMTHFNHVAELTEPAILAVDRLLRAGAIVANQTPLIAGVNDDVGALRALFNRLSFIGAVPYYVFQCRPTVGNRPYAVPLERAYEVFREAQARCAGLARRARFALSHASGKIIVAGMTDDRIAMRYHQAADRENIGRLMLFERNPEAFWFDDYLRASAGVDSAPGEDDPSAPGELEEEYF